MMKKLICLLLSLTLTAGLLCACGSDNASDPTAAETTQDNTAEASQENAGSADAPGAVSEATLRELKGEIEDILVSGDFGGAVYVTLQGQELYSGGTGKAVKSEDIPNSADVVYRIASNTKQFTAAAILRLCEEGRLSLDDTLGQFYPEYEAGRDITLHHLLSMQSGIPDYLRSYDEAGYETDSAAQQIFPGVAESNSSEVNRAALQRYIFSLELLFEQGERYSYSNSNFFLMGGIIEQVTGMSYHEYIQTNFFDPLGMDTAGFIGRYDREGVVEARGYRGGNAAEIFAYPGIAFACGDIIASPKDLCKWARALHGGRVLSDEMYQKMITPYVADKQSGTSYGYGLMILPNLTGTVYFHGGSYPGFMSSVCFIPAQDYFIAVISNHSNENTMSLARRITQLITERLNR